MQQARRRSIVESVQPWWRTGLVVHCRLSQALYTKTICICVVIVREGSGSVVAEYIVARCRRPLSDETHDDRQLLSYLFLSSSWCRELFDDPKYSAFVVVLTRPVNWSFVRSSSTDVALEMSGAEVCVATAVDCWRTPVGCHGSRRLADHDCCISSSRFRDFFGKFPGVDSCITVAHAVLCRDGEDSSDLLEFFAPSVGSTVVFKAVRALRLFFLDKTVGEVVFHRAHKGKGKGKCIAVCINTYTATGNTGVNFSNFTDLCPKRWHFPYRIGVGE